MIYPKSPIICALLVTFFINLYPQTDAQQCRHAQCNVNGSGWNSQLTVTSLDDDGAVLLIWQYNTIDDQYIVMHRLIGSINYTISSPMNSTNHTLTGLLGASAYEVKVCLVTDPTNCGNCQQCYNTLTFLPSQIEQSSVSVFRGERGSNDLIVLLTWTALTSEQAGGILTSYVISLYNQPSRTLLREITVNRNNVLEELTDLMANQMYSFTVRAVNRAGSGNESEEVMFNTNGPQPPMELLAVNSEGVAGIIRNNQSTVQEAGFSTPFTIDNRIATVYYIESGKVLRMSLRNPQDIWVLANMPQGVGDVMSIAYDWITRVLYFATSNETQMITIWSLPLDNPLFEPVHAGDIVSNDSNIFMTIAPFTGQLYWIEAGTSVTSLNQLNLVNNTYTQLYPSNSRKRNVMCSQSGLDTIGELTATLTYDVITDHLWVSTVSGDIWSCDLSGCNCSVRVNGTTLVPQGEMLIDIGLPTDSISLDSVNIYWSGPTGVFYVPRSDVTMLSQLSDLNTSSIVTIDPGQQPLPEETCLFPAVNVTEQPRVECINATNSTLQLRWFAPNITDQCRDQLVTFPTINYIISYRPVSSMNPFTKEVETFNEMITLTNLESFTEYMIEIQAVNMYTPPGASDLPQTRCTTQPTVLPGPVADVNVFPQSTSLFVTWNPPMFSSSEVGGSNLLYVVELREFGSVSNGAIIIHTNNNGVNFTELQPTTPYSVTIAPIILGAMVDPLVYCTQTLDNVTDEATIIIATGTEIVTNSIDSQSLASVIINNTNTTEVAYDSQRDILYLVVDGHLAELPQPGFGSGVPSLLAEITDGSRMAVDYIGQRLYWIESGTMVKYVMIDDNNNLSSLLLTDEEITDLAVDSPSGLLFWAHNGAQSRGISMQRLNGLGGQLRCVIDNDQSFRYLAITVDTENKRVFWVKEIEGSFQIGVADYESGSCINHVYKMVDNKPSIDSTSDRRVSIIYVAGVLLHTSSVSSNTIFITPSNFSSFPSTDYRLATGRYNISTASGDINIRSVFANQTSLQFLPDNVELNVATVMPTVPSNIRLDSSSNATFINITWDIIEGVSPAIMTYEVTYNLSRINGSIENNRVLKISDNYFVLENQSPETTVNVSIRAYTRWYSSDRSPVVTLLSDSRLPSQIEQSSVSVFRGEKGSNELIVLLTWTALTSEQAGGILTSYIISLYNQPSRTLLRDITVNRNDVLEELTDLMANQMYSFTVRAVNRAGSGNESEEVMFNTNGPQPPMELLAVDSEGVAGIIRNNQSTVEEAGFSTPFTVDNRNSTVYYIESGKVFKMPLRNPQFVSVLAGLPESNDDILQIVYDWITRVFYVSFSTVMVEGNNISRILTIYSLPLDNPVFRMVHKGRFLFNDTQIVMTIAPRIGHLYWIEFTTSVTSLNQLNLVNNTFTQLYPSNSRKRNVMCSQSGLDTIGELTATLTYDVITDHLWVSTVSGDIWSCDLSGCNCSVRVNGTTLLTQNDTLIDIGLPTDSISLDSVNIYWSGPTGVFYVPRSDVTMLSQLSDLNTSSIVTIDPGQQPLPDVMCLAPLTNSVAQPTPMCSNVTDSSFSLTWFAPNVTEQCRDQLVTFPTLMYTVNYRFGTDMTAIPEMLVTFDLTAEVTGLNPDITYRVNVLATNPFTRRTRMQPNFINCETLMSVPGVVLNLTATAHSTRLLLVSWERPIFVGSSNTLTPLTYYISLNGSFYDATDDSTTNISIPALQPNTPYYIEVFANNTDSQGVGEAVKVEGTTWPLPPVPEIIMPAGNTSLVIRIPLGEIYEPLEHLSLIMKESRNMSVVRKNVSIAVDRLQPIVMTVDQLRPNIEYAIQTHATYRMTDYNANENLTLYSAITRQRTEVGVPDAPTVRLVDGRVLVWDKPNNNGRNITSYMVTVISADAVNVTTVPNETTSFNLASLQFSNGFQSNVTVQAVNDVGTSNQSNLVPYNASSVPSLSSSSSSDIFTGGVMAGIIIACIIAGIFLIVLTMVMFTCCCRSRSKKMDFYDFRIDLPYNNELRVLRMSQMRMANNDLYMCDYSEEDLEALKQIPKESVTLDKELGRGAFGEVWAGTAEDIMGPGTGTHRVAVKMLQKNAAEDDKRSFLSEALVMSNFNHPNVLPVLGVCLDKNPFFLILELMEAGDLLAFLRGARQENGPPLLTVEELVKIALDVANGARYLETQHFVHRDLAARNCLVSSKGPDRVVKIGDFGLARDVYHSDYYRKEGQGLLPVRWMAPESLLDGNFSVDSDIWSYGILLWEITTLGRQPYPARSNQEVFQFVIGGGRCDKPDNCHPKLYWLMKNCWEHRAEDRLRFRVIVDVLGRLHDRLSGQDSEYSDTCEESEEEDDTNLTPDTTMSSSRQTRTTVGSTRSFRSSIRSGASFIASGIATLTRSSRLMNSIRNRASLHRSVPNGNSYQSSVENLIESKEQDGFREIGPF